MKTFNYENLDKIYTTKIVNLLSKIHEYKGSQQLYIESKIDILQNMLDIAKIQSTDASNRIEGIYTSDSRLKAIVNEKAQPLNRSEKEISGYREVLSMIHESYEFIDVTPNIILQLHRKLYTFYPFGNVGKWKISDNIISEIDIQGKEFIRFKPISAFETPQAMESLCKQFDKAIKEEIYDPLLLVPIFILDFLCIHPFHDGNGRMSRLLTLLLLYKQGYVVGKYISIEMIIEKTKESYYDVLYSSSQYWAENKNDYIPFIEYYLEIILNAYVKFAERVGHLKNKKITKADRVKNVFDDELRQFSKGDIEKICPDISVITIERALKGLLEDGYITKVGNGRNTVYIKKR